MSLDLGGLAAGYQGYQQAEQQEQLRRQGLEDRQFQQGQRARLLDTQQRADALRDANAAIPTEVTTDTVLNPDRATTMPTVDDSGDPSAAQLPVTTTTTRQTTPGEQLRALAINHKKAGDIDSYMKYTQAADKSDWDRSAKAIGDIEANSAGRPLVDTVTAAADVFTKDPYGGKVDNIKANPDGTVTFDTVNEHTKERVPRTVKSQAELFDMLRAHYSPDTFDQIRQAKAKHMWEMENESFKAKVKGDQDRQTEEVKGKAAESLETLKHGHKVIESGVKADGKPFKLDEDDKIRLNAVTTRVRDAEKAVTESMKNVQAGEDVTQLPGVQYAQKMLKDAKRDQFKTHIELGQIQPGQIANDIMTAARDPKEVMKSLTELNGVAGPDFADQVAAAVNDHDAWKQMSQKPKGPPGLSDAEARDVAKHPNGVVVKVDGKWTSVPAGAAPAPVAPAAAGLASRVNPNADLAAQYQREALEMGNGTRMQFSSPEVAAYGRQMVSGNTASLEAANRARSDADFQQVQRQRRQNGY